MIHHPDARRHGRNQAWFDRLDEVAKEDYVKANPNTKFRHRGILQAQERLRAAPYWYDSDEVPIVDQKNYPKCVSMAEKLVAMQRKLNALVSSFHAEDRAKLKELIQEETGYVFPTNPR